MANKNSKILLVGASGFTGKRVLIKLLEQGYHPTLLLRHPTASTFPKSNQYTIIEANLDQPESLAAAFEGHTDLLFTASMGFGHMPAVVEAAEKAGIKRAIFISSTAIFTRLNAKSKDGRAAGEAAVVGSPLNYTIIRPTMIFGRPGDRNIEKLVGLIRRWPSFMPVLFPLPNGGSALQQPVFVDDVATAVVSAWQTEETAKNAYNISGGTTLSFKELVRTIAEKQGKNIIFIPIPLFFITWPLKAYEALCALFKITPRLRAEQFERLNEDKNFDHTPATEAFNFQPHTFDQGLENLFTLTK